MHIRGIKIEFSPGVDTTCSVHRVSRSLFNFSKVHLTRLFCLWNAVNERSRSALFWGNAISNDSHRSATL